MRDGKCKVLAAVKIISARTQVVLRRESEREEQMDNLFDTPDCRMAGLPTFLGHCSARFIKSFSQRLFSHVPKILSLNPR
jgi:hypothetical protein